MCGIAGYINKNNFIENTAELYAMTKAIEHRGPDDNGMVLFSLKNQSYAKISESQSKPIYGEWEGGVGFNRLSIMDLSHNGHQPMINHEHNVILCFNGEIYNAFDYKDFLISKGFKFRSQTDTEVILYLYQHYGFEGMLEKLNGMFAICIIDLNKEQIYLARDRMGIKPLYYYQNENIFMFASEIKAFLFNAAFTPELETSNMGEYSKFGHIFGSETLLKNVFNVEPGQFIVYKNNSIKKKIYWSIYNGDETLDHSFSEAMDLVEAEVQKSLKLRLMSDVKIGCQLSGGIDSSLITLITAKNLQDYDLNSVSIIHDDESCDEEKWIDQATEVTGVTSHKYKLTDNYFWDNLARTTWHYDDPIFSPCVGIHLLAKQAKKFFTVFLSGEGADELFGGYSRFQRAKVLNNKIYATLLKMNRNRWKDLKQYFILSPGNQDFNTPDWLITRTAPFSLRTLRLMNADMDLTKAMQNRRGMFDEGAGDFIRKVQRYELKTWLVSLLGRQDKMTMASAVENRVPFMDHNLVDIVRRLPTKYLVKISHNANKNSKIILKKIAEKHFNKEFVYRRKMGFPIPVHQYFSGEPYNSWLMDEMVPDIKKRGIYNGNLIPDLLNNKLNIYGEKLSIIWKLVTFEIWAKLFLDKQIPIDSVN